ncbi:uncharacterized protein LOC115732056 [Rhodamnia argentea]|uniref:Uncharacterized protein LOC115732056 n=1 Tax=Rhodamnia argentea TaxID=178133 RepID=A0A8B8N838_9MYRT|nr:uncharacterized protein LOC115732056 [Rhodamnia argentea]
MDALFSEFAFLSDQSLRDKNFDPAAIEDDLMRLFELEAYKSWAAAELDHLAEAEAAEAEVDRAEAYLDSVMEGAMEEFRRFEEEMDRMAKEEMEGLVATAERARLMGSLMEKAATVASKKYIEAAVNAATASMKSAWKGISSHKVHPS